MRTARVRDVARWLGWLALGGGVMWLAVACMPQESTPRRPERLATVDQAVVGGQPDNSQPAVGAMVTKSGKSSYCTGTLIGSRLVITAAHCAGRPASGIQFRVDMPNGSSVTPTYYDVAQQVLHPQYGRTSRGIVNDLALAILTKDVTGVAPMPVNTQAMGNNWVGRKIFFIGYGLIQTTPQRQKPNNKYSAEITLRRMQSDRFETSDSGKSICSGDSGGPALYKINGRMTLVGVNSYVTGRSAGGQPYCDGSGWDFRVDPYNAWLQPYLAQYGGKCTSDSDCGGCYTCDTNSGKCQPKVVAKTAQYCTPCSGTSCGNGGSCEALSGGYRCLQLCDADRCCPQGTTCETVDGKAQCVPDKDLCPDWKCQSDKDCGPGEACASGVCKPAPVPAAPTLCGKCTSHADCNGGQCVSYPEGKYCTQPCNSGLFCPTGYTCKDVSGSQQCVPSAGLCSCKTNTDCYTGFACTNGHCLRQGGGKYGDVCDSRRPCAQGYSCVQQGNSARCFQTCAGAYPSGSPGAACGGTSGRTCDSGLTCAGISGVGNICFRRCNSNSECLDGGTCTRLGSNFNICRCTADSQCKNGATCNRDRISSLGQCAKKSNTGNQCASGFSCQLAEGVGYLCLPGASQGAGEECDATRTCQSGLLCANTDRGNSVCIRQCSNNTSCQKEGGSCIVSGNTRFCSCNNAACSAGYRCKDISSRNKVCTQGPCQSDDDCNADERCNNGTCEKKPSTGCKTDNDCPAGHRCNNGACEKEPTGCTTDADCGDPDLRCDNGQCVNRPSQSCFSDKDCPTGEACKTGVCISAGTCRQDSDCDAREQCLNSQCKPRSSFCSTDDNCPVGQRCVNGRCVTPQPETPAEPTHTETVSPEPQSEQASDGGGTPTDQGPPRTVSNGCVCSTQTNPQHLPLSIFLLLWLPLLIRRRSSTI